jgi:hypothetical protein
LPYYPKPGTQKTSQLPSPAAKTPATGLPGHFRARTISQNYICIGGFTYISVLAEVAVVEVSNARHILNVVIVSSAAVAKALMNYKLATNFGRQVIAMHTFL